MSAARAPPLSFLLCAAQPLAVLVALATLFDGQAYFLCLLLPPPHDLQASHLGDLQQRLQGDCVIGQGPECVPASSPEWCPSLVTTTVTLINSHLCKQKGHRGDNGFSCQRGQLGAAGLGWFGFALLSLFGSPSGKTAAGLGGFLGPGPLWLSPTLSLLSLRPQGIPKRVAVSLLGVTCWSPAAPDAVLSSCESRELPEGGF